MNYETAREKAARLVAQMTNEECISQLLYDSKPIERLGVGEYNWWNEALHGVARAGTATVFPQAIGLAATFSPTLVRDCAEAISVEGRAKYNASIAENDRDIYKGLTFFSPNINIFRDPRWGRGQETYGEDPYLTAQMGCAFVRGLQGEGEFLRVAACVKHFAAHSGPEGKRHGFDAVVSEKDLWETYLPAFLWTVKKAGVAGVMGAYNRTNGEPCCASKRLIREILLDDWGFEGYVVSDYGALADIMSGHHRTSSHVESAALALKMGCDLNLGSIYRHLSEALLQGLVSEDDIRRAAVRVFTVRYLLGEFEKERPYADIPLDKVCCEEHRALNLEAARQSLVLLKNENGFLPLDPQKVKKMAAVGPNIGRIAALEGNYNGHDDRYTTVLDGLRMLFPETKVYMAEGSNLVRERLLDGGGFGYLRSGAVAVSRLADVTVLCLGLDPSIEGEEGCTVEGEGCDRGDRTALTLPTTQLRLAEAVCEACENVIVVVLSGSPMDVGETVRRRAKAILHGWYPGAAGGQAIAELICGRFSPSGRLPVSFPYADSVLPDFEDYGMAGRTYRYSEGELLYPFGYGLSYTSFCFSNARFADGRLSVTVKNTGGMASHVPIQVYATLHDPDLVTPKRQLCGLQKVFLGAGEERRVVLPVEEYWLCAVDGEGRRRMPRGGITFTVGDTAADERSLFLTGGGSAVCRI